MWIWWPNKKNVLFDIDIILTYCFNLSAQFNDKDMLLKWDFIISQLEDVGWFVLPVQDGWDPGWVSVQWHWGRSAEHWNPYGRTPPAPASGRAAWWSCSSQRICPPSLWDPPPSLASSLEKQRQKSVRGGSFNPLILSDTKYAQLARRSEISAFRVVLHIWTAMWLDFKAHSSRVGLSASVFFAIIANTLNLDVTTYR